jgi:hypothetical protein
MKDNAPLFERVVRPGLQILDISEVSDVMRHKLLSSVGLVGNYATLRQFMSVLIYLTELGLIFKNRERAEIEKSYR